MNIFYIDGQFLQIEREDSESDEFFSKRLIFFLDHRNVKDIQQYSFIYANKVFYGLAYNDIIEEQLEIIISMNKKKSTVKHVDTDMTELPDLDYMTYFSDFGVRDGSKMLIVSQTDESFDAVKTKDILRPLSGCGTIRVSEIQEKNYETIVVYLSLPLIERAISFFLKMHSMLLKEGILLIIDPLTIVDHTKDEFMALYMKLWPCFTQPVFHRPSSVRSLMETCDFTFVKDHVFLVDATVTYLFTKN